jgi:hypothetical protein
MKLCYLQKNLLLGVPATGLFCIFVAHGWEAAPMFWAGWSFAGLATSLVKSLFWENYRWPSYSPPSRRS